MSSIPFGSKAEPPPWLAGVTVEYETPNLRVVGLFLESISLAEPPEGFNSVICIFVSHDTKMTLKTLKIDQIQPFFGGGHLLPNFN